MREEVVTSGKVETSAPTRVATAISGYEIDIEAVLCSKKAKSRFPMHLLKTFPSTQLKKSLQSIYAMKANKVVLDEVGRFHRVVFLKSRRDDGPRLSPLTSTGNSKGSTPDKSSPKHSWWLRYD